ncbi:MAG TPA: PAS domain-containing protein, partial [Holophaga sp.]|nr:PAS domain-containing protein [Holophaga sp.]
MLNFPFLNYVSVRGDGGFLVEAGVRRAQDIFEQEIPLGIVFRGQPVALGTLYLQADTSLVLRAVMAQVSNALLFQSAMVALVVAFFYLLFQGMVTRHLATVAQYFKTFDMEGSFTPLALDKRRRGDEFDILADTFNAMHEKVLAMYQEVLTAQQVTKAGEERLNMALDASGAGIWDVDYDAQRIHVSARDKNLFGYDASGAPMTFETWAERLHPDDLPVVRRKLAAVHRNETEVLLAEYRYLSGPGQYRWMHIRGRVTRRDAQGGPARMIGIMMDLTERMLIQQSLNEKERFASTVVESLPGLFVMFDDTFRVVRWNRNFASLVG